MTRLAPDARRNLLGALLLAAAVSCGTDPRPALWVDLTHGYLPDPDATPGEGWDAGFDLRLEQDGQVVWVELPLERGGWTASSDAPGTWTAPTPATAGAKDRFAYSPSRRLRAEGRDLVPTTSELAEDRRAVAAEAGFDARAEGSGLFYRDGDRLVLLLPEDDEPPELAHYGFRIDRGKLSGNRWHATVASYTGAGFSLWPGEGHEVECSFPAGSVLRFQVGALALLRERASVTFRIALDGEELFEESLELDGDARVEPFEVPLGNRDRVGVRFAFEVEGDPAAAAFFHPVVGPAETGTYGDRPWGGARPDVVLFSADTFRADNLAAYGGREEIAPNMNRLAERSVRFLRARSTSVWTLPSHSSMFTGLLPSQHGANGVLTRFPDNLETIAEHLRAFGYRTGAVTDAGYVSRDYGFDQGFEWFEETMDRRLDKTLARSRSFLERDDGRPVFLFVHTYRVHRPYALGSEQLAGPFERLLSARGGSIPPQDPAGIWGGEERLSPGLRQFRVRYRNLYLRGVHAFDEAMGPWLDGLEELGLMGSGYFVFTSDHGEEFYEHGNAEHKGPPHEEKVRIPMLIHGPDLEPADVVLGVSLVDLAPTISGLVDLPPVAEWWGETMVDVREERPSYSFHTQAGKLMAVTEGERKVYFSLRGDRLTPNRVVAVYDLAADPDEQHNLALAPPEWLDGFVKHVAPRWTVLRSPVGATTAIDEDPSRRADLEALGYVE